MKTQQRDLTTTGIILHKAPFQETSEILEILTENYGKITAIAKGVKRKNSKLLGLTDIMNELNIELYNKPGSNWYILKSAELISAHAFNTRLEHNVLIQSVIEIFRQIELSDDDWEKLYILFNKFIDYIKTVKFNPIAIFWRFLLNLYKQLGIELNLKHCAICKGSTEEVIGFSLTQHGLVCRKCSRSVRSDSLIQVSPHTAEIFKIFNSIGNYLSSIDLDNSTIREINNIFLLHLSDHFQKNFHLRSIELYSQLNPDNVIEV